MLNDNAKAVIDKLQYIIDRFVKVKFYPTPRKIVNEPHVIEKQSDDTYISFFGEIVSDKEKYEVRVFKETTLEQSFPDFNEYTLVKTMPTKANECYVDRENNLIYFHSSQDTSEISITYYSIGIGMLSSALVYTHFDSNNKVIETLYSLTKKCQEELDRISTVTNAEQLRVELQSYIESLLELIRLYPNPGVVVAELTNLINQANESSLDLKTSIGEAERFLTEIKTGSNRFVEILPSSWEKTESGRYKFEYYHNLNTKNLVINTTEIINGIETNSQIDYEKPNDNKIIFYTSDNTIRAKAIMSASYYPGILGDKEIGVISADNLEDGVDKVVMTREDREAIKNYGKIINNHSSQLEHIDKKIKISITDYGAKGDGITDNTLNIQNAINECLNVYNATGVKCCLYIPKGKYKITNYLELRDSSIDIICEGEILQDINSKYGFKFYNMKNIELKINLTSNATVESFVQSTAISEQVNGLIVGVQLLGCQRIKLDMYFNNFYGRGIESIGSWQFNNGRISGVVGQAIFVKKPTAGQIGLGTGIGELGHYYVEELTGSYFNGMDISIAYYENYIGYHSTNPCSKGVIFDDCTSLWLGDITIGCTSNDYIISFLECNNVNFNHLFGYGNWSSTEVKNDTSQGILIRRCFNLNGDIHTLKCKGNALTIVGMRNSKINWFNFMSENSGIIKNATDYDVSASEISLSDRNRYGVGLYLNNDSNGSILTDGLKLTVNVINQISTNVNKEDLIINDPNAIVDVRGRMINAKFVENNNIRQYAKITTLSGAKAKFDFNNMLIDNWTDFSPTITWNTATPTGVTSYCRYKQIGKTVHVKLKIVCTNANGTDGFTDITLPLPLRKTFYNVIIPYCIVANTTKRTEYFEINYPTNSGKVRSYFTSPVTSGNLELYLDFVYETD